MIKRAYHKRFDFVTDSGKYLLFLKQNLKNINPLFYSVAYCREVKTTDGPMYAIRIITELDDPSLEPIAECLINNQFVYLWRNHCWSVAVDQNGSELIRMGTINEGLPFIYKKSQPCHKTLLIHKIGTEPIEG